jgi:ABC-2 type transport system permease protein
MNTSAVLTVARKELRTYFQSPVALIFLGIFLVGTLAAFFTLSSFFARNLADVRPLFQWLPLLLIFLVSAITMRQWAEERKMGTLEILLTLPLGTRELVLGKFIAGVVLVGIALAMTFPLPLMVAQLGDLDWGPVIGGYLAALLLGSTYTAIGLCVSSRTDNMVVSLMVTLVVGGAAYLIGTDQVTAFFSNSWAEGMRALGTGARFESIERGVIDIRDLVYYGGLTTLFLMLNWAFLESSRIDTDSAPGKARANRQWALVALVAANVVLANVWLAPINTARLDLTADKTYSISPVTKTALSDLAEPLTIRGFFSERTHPELAPLIPQIKDLLSEYQIYGDGNVTVSFADPNADEELEQEINEQYGIRPVPFRVADRHQQAVVNSYFHLLIVYGDQDQTLSFQDLIDVKFDDNGLDVRLKNLEYDLTRTIKRISQDFQGTEALFARLPAPLEVTPVLVPGDHSRRLRRASGPDRHRRQRPQEARRRPAGLHHHGPDHRSRARRADRRRLRRAASRRRLLRARGVLPRPRHQAR